MNALTKIYADHVGIVPDDNFVVVIATWDDEASDDIKIQNFISNGESFIPIFSDVSRFKLEVSGSGFENNGVLIRKDILSKILSGDEVIILNPGSDNPERLSAKDIS